MAEAVVDGVPAISRFYCHKCSTEIERLLPDYTCPNCSSGFIEKLENEEEEQDLGSDLNAEDDFTDFEQSFMDLPDIPELSVSADGNTRRVIRARQQRDAVQNRYGFSNSRQRRRMSSYENLFHDFLSNLSTMGIQRQLQTGQSAVPSISLFLGNPGDYVWGRDGLDTIVTQLLNQMDGSGPPPLSRELIDNIPTTPVSQSQIDCKLQCSICWEDFALSEHVRQLPCKHIFHSPCIIPWLELHGTCPICRQSLGEQTSAEANQDEVGPSLAALFRAANQFTSTPTSTSSNSSNTDPSNEM